MNGSWKNNVSGWNNKDTKRKKQTHNHRLKDNGAFVVSKFDGWRNKRKLVNAEVFRTETETVLVTKGEYNTNKPIVTTADVFSVFVTWNKVDDEGNFILDYREKCTTWYSKNTYYKDHFKTDCRMVNVYSNLNRGEFYYVEGTTKSLGEFLELSKRQTRSIETTSKRNTKRTVLLSDEMVKNAIERKNVIKVEDHDADGDFIYGKPLASWKRNTFFGDGKRRKYAQNRANRMDRRNIKSWIEGHDISKPLKTHALSKSILWEIY